MQKVKLSLDTITESKDNPRKISEFKLEVLAKSLLAFPKMLEMRPIVVNQNKVVIGGTMRFRALNLISSLSESDFKKLLAEAGASTNKKEKFWQQFRKNKTVEVMFADDFSEFEEKDFIIKDNTIYGKNDNAKLAKLISEENYNLFTGDNVIFNFDEPINYKKVDTSTVELPIVSFDCSNITVPLTENEAEFLDTAYDDYFASQGKPNFFLHYLLSKVA